MLKLFFSSIIYITYVFRIIKLKYKCQKWKNKNLTLLHHTNHTACEWSFQRRILNIKEKNINKDKIALVCKSIEVKWMEKKCNGIEYKLGSKFMIVLKWKKKENEHFYFLILNVTQCLQSFNAAIETIDMIVMTHDHESI